MIYKLCIFPIFWAKKARDKMSCTKKSTKYGTRPQSFTIFGTIVFFLKKNQPAIMFPSASFFCPDRFPKTRTW
jgi:hypothetical protein